MTKKKKGVHYVNNADFLAAMAEWKDKCKDADELGDPQPLLPTTQVSAS